ncbi:MAG TPA: quinone-dependent dihydroorotate dehydrogenase [Thermoanaerobaculia bacterium]|nr:quinone-dependent dihydroorotate dehydrogenase [Thermoanaerobaculia bacterium]
MTYRLLRDLMFRLDAEGAHEFVLQQMQRFQEIELLHQVVSHLCQPPAAVARNVWGLRFPTPIGIAGGFDKNAVMIPMLTALGFGFVEVGTVTLRPQAGNPRPRLFRYPSASAIVNRLGFNNEGADLVAERLHAWSSRAATSTRPPLFVNIGKNRDVPLDRAPDDYAKCYMRVARWADGCVLNLSSPNTPSLRDLQQPEHLAKLLTLIRQVREEMYFARPGRQPILVKIAPDLDEAQIDEICAVCSRLADGMICTNTTIDRNALPAAVSEAGGVSGKPLFAQSTRVLAEVRRRVGPGYPLIGVGGVFTADDVRAKLDAGADLIQIYTGFVYEGPGLPSRLARSLPGNGV